MNKYLVLALAGLAAAAFGCDDGSSSTITDMGCQNGYELCGDSCCTPGSCDENNVCRDSDNKKCGAEQKECEPNQVCTKGKCIAKQEACTSPKKVCEGSCINVSSDPNNCGDCGVKCDEADSCSNGTCVKGCADGYTLIDGQCYNTSVDSEHCGEQNVACGENQYCAEDKSDNVVKCMCMNGHYDCDGDASNGCESTIQCEFVCESGEKSCSANMCCPETSTCCGSSCCAEGTTCCGDDACYDLQNDAHNCGNCANECKASEICMEGNCVDNAEQTCEDQAQSVCWGECVDLMNDSKNCESCGHACDEGFECKEAQCIIACASGLTACGETCFDLTKDNMNCGACGTKCDPSTQCVTDEEGTSCKATSEVSPELVCNTEEDLNTEGYVPKLECWGQCIDGTSDKDNCGACGNKCGEGYSCKDSQCAYDCAEGLTACGETCIDLTKDNMNCGACGTKCDPSTQCITDEEGTSCKATSEVSPELVCNTEEDLNTEGYIPKLECWGQCINAQTDNDNCGACGNKCGEEKECKEGACVDKPIVVDPEKCDATGYGLCYGKCINLMKDDKNCGQCLNACGNGEKCVSGTCTLQCEGLTNCGGACVDTQTSANHCGACNTKCAAGQACVGSNCQCAAGRFDCDGDPANGCESDVDCTCEPGAKQACWRGEAKNRNKGICKDGSQTCDKSGRFWSPCEGGVYPSAITCNDAGIYLGGDQNCNGIDDTSEECISNCDLIAGEMSYIGCEYWPVYLHNASKNSFYVVMSNPQSVPANIKIYTKSTYASITPIDITLQPNEVKKQLLDNTGPTTSSITEYAYRLRSDVPIVVYQFNPMPLVQIFTNDASLLLPTNTLGKEYLIMNWTGDTPPERHEAFVSIVAVEPGETIIDYTTKVTTTAGSLGTMQAGSTRQFKLKQFEILNLEDNGESIGSRVIADKKVAVYSGGLCQNVPSNHCCCDHLEEQLFPLQAWGKHYNAVKSRPRLNESEFWRIIAQKDNTTVELSAPNSQTFTLMAGEYKQIESKESFQISANNPILVGQFLVGTQYVKPNSSSYGDPSFILNVPYEQYRTDYSFLVPTSYKENYITIVTPKDNNITLDGQKLDLSGYTNVGTDFKYGYISLGTTESAHRIVADKPVGLWGYGFADYVSYGYPIGLDLKTINTN